MEMEIITFFLIGVVISLLTSIWVAIDAKKNQITTYDEPYSINTGALAWFFCCLIIWIVAFPYYLVRRNKLLSLRRAPVSQATLGNAAIPAFSKTQADSPDYEQQLRQLAKLKDDGIISATDFEQKKKAILGL